MTRSITRTALLLATAIAVIAVGGAQQAQAALTTATVAYTAYDSLDPALASTVDSWQVEYATCLKLVTYSDDPAPAGYQLVPDAATALPTVSSDGLVYTFTVQPGLKFSDGSSVTPYSFQRAIERTAGIPGAFGYSYISDIAGIDAFHTGAQSSISGVQVMGNQLQITLTQPDGAFPAKLAMPIFCAVPADTPLSEQDDVALPSAGPYYVDPGSVTTDSDGITGFDLIKNTYYTGARPGGFDQINVTTMDLSSSFAAAQDPNPTVDYTGVDSSDQAAANASFGPGSPAAAAGHQQYFTPISGAVRYLDMNTSHSKLQDVRVRQAIATAIDRTQLASDFGDTPTDDLASPIMAGYVDENNFNLSGDVAAAQALMEQAGYDNSHRLTLKLVTPNAPRKVALGNDIVSELSHIYIDVTYTPMDIDSFFGFVSDPAADWDLSYEDWSADYSDWSADLTPLLDGRTMTPTSVGVDLSHWNDVPTNSALDYANALPAGTARDTAFEQLATSLAKDSVPMTAISQAPNDEFVSSRVGCVVHQPLYHLDLARLCPANPVSAGDTYTQPGTVSSTNPVLAAVTASADGSVSVVTASASSELSGYNVLGQQLIINAPDAPDTDHPLSITLTIAAATLTAASLNAGTVAVLRNGVAIPACSPNDGTVSHGDDPCVTSRTTDGSGNALVTVLTTEASVWNFGKRDSTPPTLNSVSLGSSAIAPAGSTTISASASADAVFAEFYVDTDAGAGHNIPLGGGAGSFVSPPYGKLLSPGFHTIGVRVRDAAGNWSPVKVVLLRVGAGPRNAGLIGLNGVDMTGGRIDSFDSSLGAYGASNHGASALVLSNRTVSLEALTLSGDVISTQGSVVLATGAQVKGNATAGVSVVNPQRVSGTVKKSAPSPAVATPAVAACSKPYSPRTGISGGGFEYSATTGNLTIFKGTVTLANGTYCFHNVDVLTDASLRVAGHVTINLTGQFAAPSGRIVNKTGVPTNLSIDSSYGGPIGVSIAGSAYAYASIFAPRTRVVITDGSFFGTVLAQTLTMTGSALHVDTH